MKLYFYVSEIYEEVLKWHCMRYTKNQVVPGFRDEEILTTYLFVTAFTTRFKIIDVHEYILDHWLSYFPKLPSYTAYNTRLNRLAYT